MTVDPEKRKAIVYEMQKIVYDNFYYTQLTNHVAIDAHVEEVDGLQAGARRRTRRSTTRHPRQT